MRSVFVFVFSVFMAATSFSLWSADKINGAQLFQSKCSACHGENGEGKPATKMPAAKGTSMSVDALVKYLTKGESGKKIHSNPINGLDEAHAKAVAEYVKELK
jgi:mono/diheme cytochrome c family protein